MDKELEQAQNLTKNDLVVKLEHGRPAQLARPRRGIRVLPSGERKATIVAMRQEFQAAVLKPLASPKTEGVAEPSD